MGHALACLVLFLFRCQSEARQITHRVQVQGAELIELAADSRETGGLVWLVQLSDLHFSSYRPTRALSFKKLLPPFLALINPSLVLITGDLTDGKSKNLATMQQDESEWEQYRDAIDWVIGQSKLSSYIFFDIRGNHDKFGVPRMGGRFDYFSTYSITAQHNRSSSVQSVILQAAVQIHARRGSNGSSEKGPKKPTELGFSCRLLKRWVRKALLLACLGVAYLHAKRTWAIVCAYGMEAMLMSPGFAWPIPILLVAAVLQTSSVEGSCDNQSLHSK